MKTFRPCTVLLLLCFSCKSAKDNFQGTPIIGVVTGVNTGASPSKPGVIPYNISFDSDSILVTNLPTDIPVGTSIKFTFKDNDTLPMIFLSDRIYPRRATLIFVEKL
jgi:hypothetical protein